jgi:hypothetical protein
LSNVCDFQKENHTLGNGFKNVPDRKSIALPNGFLFFVISIFGEPAKSRYLKIEVLLD